MRVHHASNGTAACNRSATARSTATGPPVVLAGELDLGLDVVGRWAAHRMKYPRRPRTVVSPGSGDTGAAARDPTLLGMTMCRLYHRVSPGRCCGPGDDGYEQARRVWNGAIDRHPAFIARCRSSADVAAMVRFGVRHGLTLAVRGGGHSIPGLSVCDGGMVST